MARAGSVAPRQRASAAPESGQRPGRRLLPRSRILLVLALVAALGAAGFGAWALYGSQWLRIEKVSVAWESGSRRELTADQVLSEAAVPLGAPMASLDKDAIEDRLLAALPRLKSVRVVRAWPHGVGLKVTEREPSAQVPAPGGFAEVDEEGVRFAEIAEPLPSVPLLEPDMADAPSVRRFDEERTLREAVAVAAALPEPLAERTSVIRIASYDAITLELSDDRTVRWGSPEDSSAKAGALTILMKAAPDARHFDVSVPSAPAASGG
ncbi:FtsQ-type POTRA domain-containing protein [Streptomyces carpaticus]|uniref:Cell division protein FtsQ n=2 Tax=Streptomyces TaxID=1883 RepID=A0A1I6RV05_9ACTN|nr:FtsQ-type POTRA domain-containing protein [Streptomyces harbinensis]QKV68355.1 FtsQ-type POTRA domain-containing protein [Streptomyces harbinensis]UWM48678.1 FtsQ-type POTRA domain-containing protein [Streptomyces carpaticus]SFS68565.1 cell division protein FtsQ [Streptomyces harbinensis]